MSRRLINPEGTTVLPIRTARSICQLFASVKGHVKDRAGSAIVLHNLQFDNNDFLSAALGEGQLNVTFENVKSVGVEENNKLYFATITHNDGDKLTLSINGDLLVSGTSKLGTYRAPIRKISEIVAPS